MQCLCGSNTGLLHSWFHYKTALEQHGFCSISILFQHYSSCKLQVSISPFWSFNSGADFKPCRITTAPTASTGAAAGVGAGAGSTSSLKAACRLWMKTQASNGSMEKQWHGQLWGKWWRRWTSFACKFTHAAFDTTAGWPDSLVQVDIDFWLGLNLQ